MSAERKKAEHVLDLAVALAKAMYPKAGVSVAEREAEIRRALLDLEVPVVDYYVERCEVEPEIAAIPLAVWRERIKVRS